MPEDELNLYTVGELCTGENKENNIITENQSTRLSNRGSKQLKIRSGWGNINIKLLALNYQM